MNFTNVTTAIALTSLLSACASPTDSNDRMPNKVDSSPALQIVSAAGGEDKFRDRVVPKEALRDVSATGYVSQTLLGMVFTTGLQGFFTALISDNKFLWDDVNYITFVDANKYKNLNNDDLRHHLLEMNMAMHKPITSEYANSVSNFKVNQSSIETKDIGTTTVSGFDVKTRDNSKACYNMRSNRCFIGHIIQLRGRSLPIDISLFNDELKSAFPSNKVIAIRYFYTNSYAVYARSSDLDSFVTDYDIYPSSPNWRLPKNTFMSMPEKFQITNFKSASDNKAIPYAPMVRNNDTAYYFIKPVNGEPVKSELSSYHQRYEKMVETTIAETTDSNK